MSQKNYKFAIVERLMRHDNHIRGLAKELKTNQTTIARKIRELERENVVDYRREGKNKVYSLKKTLEATEYLHILGHDKLLRTLQAYPALRKVVKATKQDKRVKLAILFGSYAKGLAHAGSDIDMYIETTSKDLKKDIELLDTRLNIKIGAYDKRNLLIKEIEKDHVIIKGVERYIEKILE